jgi:MraZ protein
MFYGEYIHTIDRKGRVIIPSKFRQVLKDHYTDRLVVTRGLDRCLFLFPEDEWRTQESRFRGLSFTKSEARRFNRLFFSGATELMFDRQGRVLIPQYLKDYAGLKRDVVLVGVSNRIEIWDKEVWKRFYEENQKTYEQIAERLLPE